MKKILSIIFIFCCFFVITAYATDYFPTSGTCGENLTWEITGDKTILRISGTGDMADYGGFASDNYAPWRWADNFLTDIVIENGVTSIGDHAFYDCEAATDITIPDTVQSIGVGSFWYCKKLENIVLPEALTSIGDSAFSQCVSLRTIEIPNSVTEIGRSVFINCSSLTYASVSNKVETIPERMFYNCSNLTSVYIPDSVTTIGNYAFDYCERLASIEIPENITYIGSDAFGNCSNLKSLYIKDLKKYCEATILSTPLLKGNLYLNGELVTELVIPDGVTKISEKAFRNCTGIKKIIVPKSVEAIYEYTFNGCNSLEEITVPFIGKSRELSNYDERMFGYIFGIEAIPEGDGYFKERLVIPETLKKITVTDITIVPYDAFSDCKNVTDIVFKCNISKIDTYAFRDAISLKNVYYAGTRAQWDSITVEKNNDRLNSVTIHTLGRDVVAIQTQVTNGDVKVNLTNAFRGDTVIFMCYNNGAFSKAQLCTFDGEEITFTPLEDYSEIKVAVWHGAKTLSPLSVAEPIDI